MKVVIIKYNAGNIQSVLFALERIEITAVVTDDPVMIRAADKVIFPGVGEASTAMSYLRERQLDQLIISLKQPVLGICLGMQLMCSHSEENDTSCLGIFDKVVVKRFANTPTSPEVYKIPQIGWNTITSLKTDLFKRVDPGSYCYFVHGYYAPQNSFTIAETDYMLKYSSAMNKDNFFGVQFHPEKSALAGEAILKNFLNL
jgi:glutamine amidotransferase